MAKLGKNKIFIIISGVIIFIFIISICASDPFIYNENGSMPESPGQTSGTAAESGGGTERDITDIPETLEVLENPETSEPQETTAGPVIEETTAAPRPPGPPVKKNRNIYRSTFDYLRARYNNNQDIVGIIKIPGTRIYYPVAQSADNVYYLDRNLYKQRSAAGSIMMDFENDVSKRDPNTVLYGHQMSATSGSMFHALNYYRDETFFKNHRYVIFNTIYEENVWEVFAFFKTRTSFNYIKVYFKSEQQFLDLAAEMKKRSMHDSGIEIQSGDRILTLSTCTNIPGENDSRYVLVARMIKNKDDVPPEMAEQMAAAVEGFR